MINTRRKPNPSQTDKRVDPTVVREPVKIKPGACLACASRSRVAQHTCR